MFNFMKKGAEKDERDKEKRKKEKKDGKKRRESGMTSEELLRLDEVRRSLKIRGRRKEKLPSGITADYSENFFADLERDPEFNRTGSLPGHTLSRDMKASPPQVRGETSAQSDSSETSLNSLNTQAPHKTLPPLPPRPPKRGILKGPKTAINNTEYYENHDSTSILVRNTLQNELITYQNVQPNCSNSTIVHKINHNQDQGTYSSPEHSASHYLTPLAEKNQLGIGSTSPSAESLTDTTNSSFATPLFSLSPVGESQGFAKLHSSVFDKNTDLPLPDIVALDLPEPRELTILRTARGDFGFQLRRAIVTDKLGGIHKKGVTFAEPGVLIHNHNDTGLLPGDVLQEVNGVAVYDKTREDIIDMIRNSGASVLVKVQPIAELCELSRRNVNGCDVELDASNIRSGTLKRSSSQRFKGKTRARSEEELASQRACLASKQLWLVHRGGFTAVQLVSSATDGGKVQVRVEKNQQVLEVDEDDLEKVNPEQGGKVSDLSQLRYLNESSVLHVMRQRYVNNLIHTTAAGNLVIVNPQCCLSLYNDKVAALFHGCKPEDMPPHIYATTQTAYRAMLSSRKDQSIVLLGRSGSGKSYNVRHILTYLLQVAGAVNKVLSTEKLNAMLTVVEAFGSARSCLNTNATRCTNLISVDFDQSGQIASLNLQMLMLEKQRVAKRPSGESTFQVLYYLVYGAEGNLCKHLSLDSASALHTDNPYLTHWDKVEDRQRAVLELSKLSLALAALGVSDKEVSVLWSVLAAIYHLGHAGSVRVGTNKWQFADPVHSLRAAKLLGTTSEDLSQALWGSGAPQGSPTRTPSPDKCGTAATGQDCLDGLVVGLYSEVVNVVNTLVNRCLTNGIHTAMSLIVADSPGLQNPGSVGQQGGAGFADLCHNYVQERLHLLLHNTTLQQPLDRYTQEHVELELENTEADQLEPSQLVSILDKTPPSGVLKTSQTDLREAEKRGLLFLLDEESIYPNGSDDTFVERLFQHCDSKERQMYMRRYNGAGQMVIQHLQGTSPVVYNVRGWMAASKMNPAARTALTVLQESTREDVSELFITGRGGILPADSNQSLRRASSIRRSCNISVKNKSLCLQVKYTADSLIETLRRTRPRFVLCMLAHHSPNTLVDNSNSTDINNVINVPLLRSQVRGFELLSAVRLYKQGYPDSVPHSEFRRRFQLLAGGGDEADCAAPGAGSQVTVTVTAPEGGSLNEPRMVEAMLAAMDIDTASYRIGLSQVFLRAGVLVQLEATRDEKLADLVVQLQSRCRGYLARKKLSKLKIQDVAVRCIQRNVQKLMMVREWPWWRLYVKVTPLLNVHRTEEELSARLQELEAVKAKLEKVETERNQLKLDNERLENKVAAQPQL